MEQQEDLKSWSRNRGLESSKALEPELWNAPSRGAKLGWEFPSYQNPFPGNSHPIHGVFPKSHRELRMRKGNISTRGSQGAHFHPPYPKIGMIPRILLEFAELDSLCPSPAIQILLEEPEIPKSMPGHPMVTITGQKCPFRHFPLFQVPAPGAIPTLGPTWHKRPPKQRSTHKSRLIHGIHPKKKKSISMDERPRGSKPLITLHPTHPSDPKLPSWTLSLDPALPGGCRSLQKEQRGGKAGCASQRKIPSSCFPSPGWMGSGSRIHPRAQGGGEGLLFLSAWRILTK